MPVFGTFHRRRGGLSHASRRAVRSRPPRNLQYSDAGSRWAYRGRPAHPYAQSARDTPRQHSLGGRDRCPVCAPGAAYAPDLLILSCWHPGKTGPRRAESRYQGAFWRIPGASNKYAVRPHATRPGVPRSTCDSPERRWHPRRGRTRWQCGSQLRMTGRTDGPEKKGAKGYGQ